MSSGMNHDMGGMDRDVSPLGDVGDVAYLHYLVNGRVLAVPRTLTTKSGRKIRLRVVNTSSDIIFKLALQGHRLTIACIDGFPVTPTQASAVYLAIGERLDVTITLGDGVFALQAALEGKKGTPVRAIARTGSSNVPAPDIRIAELDGKALLTTQLKPVESTQPLDRKLDTILNVALNGQMKPYAWDLNGKRSGEDTSLTFSRGQCVRLWMTNTMMMAHPTYIHGHTWVLSGSDGLRKGTVPIRPMETIEADLQADNPGIWILRCHNAYHAELGMMTTLRC